MKADFAPGRSLVWLSSYPKSGNTWLRSMLAVLRAPDRPLDLRYLPYGMDLFDRQILDDFAAISSITMTPDELVPYQAQLFAAVSREAEPPELAKTHAAAITGAGGTRLFGPDATAGAVYLLRNPMDVAVSYAHHDDKPLDEVIARMGDSEVALHQWEGRSGPNLPQIMRSWSDHVESWTDDPGFPVLVIRYEDMLADPAQALKQVAKFCGIETSPASVNHAVEACRFDRLKKVEDADGFSEKPSETRAFFRSGQSGEGRHVLNRSQIDRIIAVHGAIMERFGYWVA